MRSSNSWLARLELRLPMERLLKRTRDIALAVETSPQDASFQANGFAALPVRFR